jgi:hypothetical protein
MTKPIRDKDPYVSLLTHAAESAREHIEDLRADPWTESPIEELFFVALSLACKFGCTEFDGAELVADEEVLLSFQSREHYKTRLLIQCQPQLDDWRPDFLIHYYDHGHHTLRPEGWDQDYRRVRWTRFP